MVVSRRVRAFIDILEDGAPPSLDYSARTSETSSRHRHRHLPEGPRARPTCAAHRPKRRRDESVTPALLFGRDESVTPAVLFGVCSVTKVYPPRFSRGPLGFEADSVEWTAETFFSRLVTQAFDSPVGSLRTSYVRVEPPSRPPLDPL
eukprot:1001434-Prorocentrum_minimum.AAC.1